jgi:hypothetical protein
MSYTNGLDKPTDYFNTVLYTGNGTADRTVTGVGFQPQWLWIKERSNVSTHSLTDIVRGASKRLQSSGTDAEFDTGTDNVRSFDSDGFTLGTGGQVNENTQTYVSWNWLANGTGSSNTDGDITSTVSANTTAGFSIVSYTGTGSNATVGHGLGSTPAMIIWKNRSASNGWIVYHHGNTSAPETDYLELHSTNGTNDLNTIMNDTAPTSSVFTVGTEGAVNNSGNNFIAYCFAEKKGYSKFGSYFGNNSTDGTFVYLGFKPAFFMLKKSSGSGTNWEMLDSTRNPGNPMDKRTRANTSEAESTSTRADFLSNGIKFRTAGGETNDPFTYIYMAFAENPFVTSTGIPTTAR